MIDGSSLVRMAQAVGWGRQAEWVKGHGRGLAYSWITGFVLSLIALEMLPQKKVVNIVLQPGEQSTLGTAAGSLASIAAKFGVEAGGQIATPLEFFDMVLQSDTIMRQLVARRFVGTSLAANPNVGTPLAEIWRHPWTPDGDLIQKAADKLNKNIDVNGDVPSGTITVTLKSYTPELYQAIGLALVADANDELERVNRDSHKYEREFLEGQLDTARAGLYAWEDSLNLFYERNRTLGDAPRLKLEETRLTQRVELAQQIYADLFGRVAAAREEEARDTPQLLVVDPGTIPADRGPVLVFALAFVTGLAFAGLWVSQAFLGEFVRARAPAGA